MKIRKPKTIKLHRNTTSKQSPALALGLCWMLTAGAAHAVDIAATGTQAAAADQWNLATWAGGQWTGGLAPSAGNTYSTGAFQIRTLNSTSLDTTFGGDSLRIVASGSLLLRNGNTNFVNGNLILDGGSLISGRPLTGGNAQDVAGNLDIASASFIDLTNGGANQNRITCQSGNFTGSGDITMSGTSDTDVLAFETTMVGSHTGNWTINGGRLVVFNDNHIGNSASVTMGGTPPNPIPTAIPATSFLDLRSGTQTIGSLSGTGGQVMGTSQTLITGGDDTYTSFGGIIIGSVSLVKEGAGTMTFSNYNSSTGSITINEGTLEFTTPAFNYNVDVFKSTQININNGSILKINSSVNNDVIPMFDGRTYTFDSNGGGSILLGTGNHNAEGANFTIRTLGGAQDIIGLLTTSGVNGFNLGGTTVTFDVALGSDATSDLVITPIISNNGSVLKTGTGRLTLTGANTYGGSTTINGGTLTLGASGVIPNASPVSLGAATLNAATTGTETAGTLDVTAAATINLGTGAKLVFTSGTATWAGTLDITGDFVSGSSLNFGSSSGLSFTQLGQITLNGGGGPFTLDGSGFLLNGISGYAAWQAANSTAQAANLDHDNDCVPNGVEFFLGGTGGTTGNTNPLPGVDNDMGTLSVTWERHPGYPGFPGNYGTAFVVETSATLDNPWTPAVEGVGPGFVEITGNFVKYTFPAGTINFARLKVTAP